MLSRRTICFLSKSPTFKLMYFSDVMKVSFIIVSRCFAVNPLTADISKISDATGLKLDNRVSL